MFLTLLTLLPLLAPTLAAPQPNADPECLLCGGMQGHASTSTATIFYDKYSTASGFSQFTSEIVRTVGTDLSAVITWAGLGLSAAEPHAL
jgi:hypothetical protein